MRRKMILPASVLAAVFLLPCGVSIGAESPAAGPAETGSISGRIMVREGGPVSRGQVMFYNAAAGPPPQVSMYERVPDVSRDLDDEGRFVVDLPPGKYYLGVVKRMSGARVGPPQGGDYVFKDVDDDGRPKTYAVVAGKGLDIGTIAKAVPLRPDARARAVVETAIEGVLVDLEGKPVADAVVAAFANPSVRGKPLFVSGKTGSDGRYILRVTEGTYYLRARNMYAGGPPQPGQMVGYYGNTAPSPVQVQKGEIRKDIDFRVILFPGRGPLSGTPPPRQ